MDRVPTNREIKVDALRMIVSRTDTKGIIEYANHDLCDISGYTLKELVGKSHNIVRHPDMPKIIFKWMWERIQNGQNIYAVVKNMAKNGDHYWVTTKFDTRKRPFESKVSGYVAYRQGAPAHVVQEISKLYAELIEVEKEHGLDASERYLEGFLDSKNMTYDEYMASIVENNHTFQSFFKKMIGLFN